MQAYHVVTERPMHAGQRIVLDDAHHSGVWRRVQEKLGLVNEIYANPSAFDPEQLEHHTAVALRELAMEEVRQARYPQYPSRMGCLYASRTLEEAEQWGRFFADVGRPTYHIVKLEAEGACFEGDAAKCFRGGTDHGENLRLAQRYWENDPGDREETPIVELLVSGQITVLEIVREINANLRAAPQPEAGRSDG